MTDGPLDAVVHHLREVGSLTLESLNSTAATGLFDWNQLLIVLVGDKEAIVSQLAEAGFATPVFADLEGKLLP